MKSVSRSAAALGFLLSAFAATSASAAVITYDFSVAPGTGPLSGNTYSGQLSFDNAGLTNSGQELLRPSDGLTVSFTFEGTTYVTSDDQDYSAYPIVQFQNGTFLGLSFLVPGLRARRGCFELQ